MKYRIWEKMLNEYVDSPTARLVEVIEANSFEEACKLAKQIHPQMGAINIDDNLSGGRTTVEFD